MNENNLLPVFMLIEDAIEKYTLKKFVNPEEDLIDRDICNALVFDSDISIDGNLDISWIEKKLSEIDKSNQSDSFLILILGNLKVSGDVNFENEYLSPSLLVLGSLECEFLVAYDELFYVSQNLKIKYLLYGKGNGVLQVKGITNVPYIINNNHTSKIKAIESLIINNANSDSTDKYLKYKYTYEDIENVFVEEVLTFDYAIDANKFLTFLKANTAVLK